MYFEVVYGILLTWFVTCSSWEDAFRGVLSPLPSEITWQVGQLLMLDSVPPLVGISIDLLIAKWLDRQYRPMAILASGVLISYAIVIVGVLLV